MTDRATTPPSTRPARVHLPATYAAPCILEREVIEAVAAACSAAVGGKEAGLCGTPSS